MRLSAVEDRLVNNPVRAFLQRYVEVPALFGRDASFAGKTVLEVGCGRGITTEALVERYSAAHVIALDIDAAQVRRARKRLRPGWASRIDLLVADAEEVPIADASVDVVVELATLHHLPRWTRCVAEISRVLKDGGTFFFEEPAGALVDHPLTRLLLRRTAEGVNRTDFVRELGRTGLRVNSQASVLAGILFLGSATRVVRPSSVVA